ncbi:hypothetical protein [Flavobacterium cerinum]|uniref:Lipoprotein n=1 Tax=Flavobacterium cerinum TaxID=2502784 RepID=A0A444GSB2_9FLAO|nr:hypothetical protein [Flavobacterium cerinum]RWW93831.1 hypothetical protein EPI11_14955 [Flavobacterium cerinum]
MKKTLLIIATAFLMTMCSTTKTSKSSTVDTKPEVQYRDGFKSASDKEKNALLKKLNAADANSSIVILTKNYKGEKIVISNEKKTLETITAISNTKSGFAAVTRIDNTVDTKIFDNYTKKEVILPAKEAQKHKYIYVMKKPGAPIPFLITYSNTLRTLE